MAVADASVLVAMLSDSASPALAQRFASLRDGDLQAPYCVDLEVANALRGLARGGRLEESRARLALRAYARLRLRRYPHLVLLERIWELRENFSAYDAAYVALAQALGTPLLTRDAGQARAAEPLITVELYA